MLPLLHNRENLLDNATHTLRTFTILDDNEFLLKMHRFTSPTHPHRLRYFFVLMIVQQKQMLWFLRPKISICQLK